MSTIDAKRDLERLRRAREQKTDSNDRGDGPDVYRCPVEGCSRTVIDTPHDLQSHVRQAGDELHRHKRLTENLTIETAWEQMDWGPGAPK